jgi:hypothetical protein
MGSPGSTHSRATSVESLLLLRHLRRQVSAASIPIFFESISRPHFDVEFDLQETLDQPSSSEPQNMSQGLPASPQCQ